MMRLSLSDIAKGTRAGLALTVVGLLLTALPGRASAQDPAPPTAPTSMPSGSLGQGFGETGQLVISGEMFTAFEKTNNAGWGLSIRPAADYFIIPAVTVGGAIGFGIGNNDQKAFEVAARVGYNLNVTEHISVWGKAGIGYGYASDAGGSESATYANLYAPINYHIVPRVFFGLGPFYNAKLAGTGANNYGLTSVVGAWW
jgi:hypothetical protein